MVSPSTRRLDGRRAGLGLLGHLRDDHRREVLGHGIEQDRVSLGRDDPPLGVLQHGPLELTPQLGKLCIQGALSFGKLELDGLG